MRSGCVGPECAAAPTPPRARCSRLLARAARARPSPLGVRAERGEARWSTSNSYRPPRIILVRHAQSLGNVDESTYQKIPDNRVPLTGRGKEQAATCGCSLRELIGERSRVYIYVSPYRRTLETAREICRALDPMKVTGVREEPRIREQDFGNLQVAESNGEGGGEPIALQRGQRQLFGRFFYRFRDGESAADVYDRVSGFRDTLLADIENGRFARIRENDGSLSDTNVVIVTHGISLRVFLMRWFKMDIKQFEKMRNPENAEPVVLTRGDGGRYSLYPFHGEVGLRELGFDDAMVAEQRWQSDNSVGTLNALSGEQWIEDVNARLAEDELN